MSCTLSLGLLLFSCETFEDPIFPAKKWDNPYDLDNEIVLTLEPIPDTIANDTTYVIKWEIVTNKGKSVRDFDVKISLFRDNLFLKEITTCNSNNKSFTWHVNIDQPDRLYRIEIKSIANYFIQARSNEFSIIEQN